MPPMKPILLSCLDGAKNLAAFLFYAWRESQVEKLTREHRKEAREKRRAEKHKPKGPDNG